MSTTNPYEPTPHEDDCFYQRLPRFALFLVALTILIAAFAFRGIAGLQFAWMFAVVFVSLKPIATVIMIRSHMTMFQIGQLIIIAGILVIVHVVLTAATVERLLRQPFVLDIIPYNRVISFTLNYVVPSSLLAFVIAATFPSPESKRLVWIGGAFVVVGSVTATTYL